MNALTERARLWLASTVVAFLSLEEQARACETSIKSLEDAQAYCSSMLCQLNDREPLTDRVLIYMWTTTAVAIKRWPDSLVAKDARGVRGMLVKRTRLRTLQNLAAMFLLLALVVTLLYQAVKHGPVRQDHRLKPI